MRVDMGRTPKVEAISSFPILLFNIKSSTAHTSNIHFLG